MAEKFKIQRVEVDIEKANDEKVAETGLLLCNSKKTIAVPWFNNVNLDLKSETCLSGRSGKTAHFSIDEDELPSNDKSYDNNHTFGPHRTFGRDTVEVLPMEHYYRNADTVKTKECL